MLHRIAGIIGGTRGGIATDIRPAAGGQKTYVFEKRETVFETAGIRLSDFHALMKTCRGTECVYPDGAQWSIYPGCQFRIGEAL